MRSNKCFDELLEEGYRPCPASKCPYGVLATCSTCMYAAYPRQQREADLAGNPLYEKIEQNDTKFCLFKKLNILDMLKDRES